MWNRSKKKIWVNVLCVRRFSCVWTLEIFTCLNMIQLWELVQSTCESLEWNIHTKLRTDWKSKLIVLSDVFLIESKDRERGFVYLFLKYSSLQLCFSLITSWSCQQIRVFSLHYWQFLRRTYHKCVLTFLAVDSAINY